MAIPHDTPLIATMAVGLSLAFLAGLVASKLRLSPIVGYLVAGILIGPYTPGFVGDSYLAEQLSEIGIVLLMFGVGLHFSIKDLLEVKGIALPGAVVQILVATGMGVVTALYWGWSLEAGLLLGLSLSVASTVVLLRALEQHNALDSLNGRIAVGWLIVEDLVMVLALVLLPVLASSFGQQDGAGNTGAWVYSLLEAFGKIILFIACMFVLGKRVFPWLLALVASTRSRELFTLSVFAVAMGVAYFAAKLFGVSFALGAFFAGMMIRESDLSHEVAEKALPFQDAFAVLFFVSVGMLFEPSILLVEPLRVLMVVLIIMVGKSAAAFLIVLLCRYPIQTALTVSASLAQIGEFSFILAGLGVAHGLLPEEGRSLILAGALISITLNPLTFHSIGFIYGILSRQPWLAQLFSNKDDALAHLERDERSALNDSVILVGYGRVGNYICENLRNAEMDLVVIDLNRERIESLREHALHAIVGDAAHPEVLKEAVIDKAIAVIVAVPNPYDAQRIVESVRKLAPHIKVLVRAQSDDEMVFFKKQKVDLAVIGTEEVARRMIEFLKAGHILKPNGPR